jgi:ribosomal protein S18 acetylase RimI-like enzyme
MSAEETSTAPDSTLTIGRAQPDDVDALVAIDASASERVRSLGYDPGAPPRPIREIVAERVARGELYLARREGKPASMVALQWDDDLWRDAVGEAVYVHGLATHRDFAGEGIGLALLRWAERTAAAANKDYLRLDCNADNPGIRAYYERAGFTHRGDIALPHRVASRYEKRTGAA